MIDFRVASECFAPVRKLKRRDFETLRLVTTYQERLCPTIGSFLLFGKDRLGQFPDAWVQAGRFDGADRSLIQDHIELTGMLTQAIDKKNSRFDRAFGLGYPHAYDWPYR